MIDLLINEIRKDKVKILKFVADNSKLKPGIYLKVNVDEPFDLNNFNDFFVVDTASLDTSTFRCDLDVNKRKELIDYIAERDILSGLLNDDANKTIDGNSKKVLSSVYQTLFIKMRFLKFPNEKFNSLDEVVEVVNNKGFDSLKNIGSRIEKRLNLKKLKIETKELRDYINYTRSESRVSQIELIKEYIENNFESIVEFAKAQNISGEGRLKLFFYSKEQKIEDSIEAYDRESSYYLSNYIFNDNSTTLIEGELKGAIPFGFNNSKSKPLIKPVRTDFKFVKYHSLNEALETKLAYDLLKLISDNRGAKLIGIDGISSEEMFDCNLDEFTNTNESNKSLYFKLNYSEKFIEDYDLVSETQSKSNRIESRSIDCINYLNEGRPFSKKGNYEDKARSKFSTKELISYIMHSKTDYLSKFSDYKLYGYSLSGKSGGLMLECRYGVLFEKYKYRIHDFLKSYNSKNDITDEILNDFTKECNDVYFNTMFASDYFLFDLTEMLNIKLNLLKRYRKEHDLLIMLEKIKTKTINIKESDSNTLIIENDSEFYFLLGQIAYYLESQNKGDLDFGIFKFYTDKRTYKNIRLYLIQRLEIYGYNIRLTNKLFKYAMESILSYEAKEDINKFSEYFYLGICCDNIFYAKKNNNLEE